VAFYQSNIPVKEAIEELGRTSRTHGRWMLRLTVVLVILTVILVVQTAVLINVAFAR